MELYRQNLKYRYFLEKMKDFLKKFSTICPRKKRQMIMEKNKSVVFFLAEALRTTVVLISILIRTTVVPIRFLIGKTEM